MKKKIIVFLLCTCLIFLLVACSEGIDVQMVPPPQQSANETIKSLPSDAMDSDNNILIAYFTWAENTQVENPDAIDVDATTSASVLLPGNAAQIAGWIQQRTDGDLFSIVVTEPYSSDYDECLEQAANEKAENVRPALVNHVENMEAYDIIFLGFPNWWYTVPMAIHSFLEEYDFSGKTVIPFVTHGTGGLSSTIRDITANLPDSALVLEPIGVYRPNVAEAQPEVNTWLDNLGFTETEVVTNSTALESASKTITMTINTQQISIVLNDTPAANALYDMMPLELTFEDYNHIEKISYLPEDLPRSGESDRYKPDVGDFCFYAPWGNLSIFYEAFRESTGLIPLGHMESGIGIIATMDGDFTATLEAGE